MTQFSNLNIAPARRPGETSPDGSFKTERSFWDFIVDGISLRSNWQDLGSFGIMTDVIGVLGWGATESELEAVAKLRREAKPDYPPNRIALYVCPECGDLGCGAVTVAINCEEEAIIWSDFRWEVNWYADRPDESTVCLKLGPFRFAFDTYVEVLNRALMQRPKAG
jgi:hypothetical protein